MPVYSSTASMISKHIETKFMKNKALFAWSGGKDSALALYEITRQQDTDIVALC